MTENDLEKVLKAIAGAVDRAVEEVRPGILPKEIGRVKMLGQGIAWAEGLPGVKAEELVYMGPNVAGMALDLLPDRVGIILLGSTRALRAGNEVTRTGGVLEIPVGPDFVGRVIDPLGNPLDGKGPVKSISRAPVFREAPGILDRAAVEKPLQTGLKVVDALVPVGRGQRELILGDRQTGKTSLAVDTMINQKGKGLICIYCAVGQRSSSVAKVVDDLERHGAMSYSLAVVAEGDDPPGLQYIAPYSATTLAEYFMHQGRDVLVVYDDLTRHALAYRQLSLLLRRPPGREAFPGDIFYIHSRLLERATHLKPELGGGSLTALPIIETEAENMSAYIPTNLISITDGQIYLSPGLFHMGFLPAVDVGKSVSRVGGKAQIVAYRKVAGDLRLSYTQFQELESFARFGTRLDEETRKTLEHGRRVREALKQDQFSPLAEAEQIAVLLAVTRGLLDHLPIEEMGKAQQAILEQVRMEPEAMKSILAAPGGDDGAWEELLSRLRAVVTTMEGDHADIGFSEQKDPDRTRPAGSGQDHEKPGSRRRPAI
ncbi:alternate F1F0 ATPase, F1 subunit alpha [Desulfococcus sp.]|uniref:alternate F1F0 ATPase, F1 subunit alpha n=1 Tax=Desulfococcus sp. TaxID=2025834 RepID=UPI003593B31D